MSLLTLEYTYIEKGHFVCFIHKNWSSVTWARQIDYCNNFHLNIMTCVYMYLGCVLFRANDRCKNQMSWIRQMYFPGQEKHEKKNHLEVEEMSCEKR